MREDPRQTAYAASRPKLADSRVRICAAALPQPGESLRFHVVDKAGVGMSIQTSFAGLMEKYGPENGFVSWTIVPPAGSFW